MPGGHYGVEERVFLRKKRGESMHHVVMKLLSYLLYYRSGLAIEVGVGGHYKPDVVAMNARGEPVLWIDCGTTGVDKLGRLVERYPEATVVIVKQREGALRRYRQSAISTLGEEALTSVVWVAVGRDLVEWLCRRLSGRHSLEVTVPDGATAVYLTLDGESGRGEVMRVGL